ncbi:Spy/CpxP family protein refolding chaperone [Rhodocyclus purpureus]|uniref:Spy/CpxP family protein refolding chaperone n=1 Tax=Rhodocyclus purpureus TaxID=1067 RepID=UPI0019144FAA|nr:Spy/CpxP family protein refolding chaperone [Rhodocyclus purpureus]MBK5914279.1 hypothetical protein [Rhodocyclus purpureus]
MKNLPAISATASRFLAVSAIALALPLSALAHEHGGHGMHQRAAAERCQGAGMPGLHGIDLSAEQVSQLAALRDEQRKGFAESAKDLREQRDALRKLAASDAYTPAAAAEIGERIAAAEKERAKLQAERTHRVYALLTPEQRTRLQQNELLGRGPMHHWR